MTNAFPNSPDLRRLCLHSITFKGWPLDNLIAASAQAGVGGLTLWRQDFAHEPAAVVGRRVRDAGLEVVSLCRGGFFAHVEANARAQSLDDNRRAMDEAEAAGAPLIVLVCGADPGQPLTESRKQIDEALVQLAPEAEARGLKLGIEPLHPMYADTRSAITSLQEARLAAVRTESLAVGVVVDVYHLWWDLAWREEIQRTGAEGRIFAYHISDWRTPTVDFLNDRGLMGEGCLPLRSLREDVERAGFEGFIEVEIFSHRLWAKPPEVYLQQAVKAYQEHA